MDIDPLLCFVLATEASTLISDISVWKLLLTVALVLLNAFFVASEFAIVKIRMSQIEIRTDLNPNLTKTAKTIVSNLDAYLAATQLGITLASLGLGWVGEGAISPIIIKILSVFGLTGPE